MKKLVEWIDEAKAKSGSDYATAKQIDVTRQAISIARSRGQITNETARKLAEYLEVNPLEIIASIEAERHPESARAWQKWVAAAAIMAAILIGGFSYNSDTYAQLLENNNMHYAQ